MNTPPARPHAPATGLSATDLFAGGGGMSEGLRQAGWQIHTAANHWPPAVATHQLNHPDTEHRSDNLSEVDWRTFATTDLLAAAPSCVWHARAGGRRKLPAEVEWQRHDEGSIDRATAFAVIAAAEVHSYRAIIVENVPEFTGWVLYDWWLAGLKALGYTVRTMLLDAAAFGHAQNRRRWFAVATRDGVHVDLTQPRLAPVHAAQILDDDPGVPVHRDLYVTPQIQSIPDGHPHLVTYRKHAKARRTDAHRLATVTAGGNHHAVAQWIDGVAHHRMLTNRECARAQGFPDAYRFTDRNGEPTDAALDPVVKRLIGNATPVSVAAWLGGRIRDALANPRPIPAEPLHPATDTPHTRRAAA